MGIMATSDLHGNLEGLTPRARSLAAGQLFLDQMKRIGRLRAEGRGRGALWFLIEQNQDESNNFQAQNGKE